MGHELRASNEFAKTLVTKMVSDVQVSIAVVLERVISAEFSQTQVVGKWFLFRVTADLNLECVSLGTLTLLLIS